MLGTLSPVVHQYDHKLYRVPLRKEGDSYTMWVGDKFTRVFADETLPDEVKSKITMVMARENQIMPDHEVTHLNLMYRGRDDPLHEIGWRVSDSWFVIVLPLKELLRLRGE